MARFLDNPYGLPDKQWRFVQAYLIDFNASNAYRRAGYSSKGHGETNAWKLLKNTKIQEALQGEATRLVAQYDVTPEKVIKEFARLGFSDMRQYATWGPQGVSLHDSTLLSDDAAMAIAEVSERVGADSRTIRFKLHSKPEALNSLARYFDLFKEAEGMQQLGKGLGALLDFAKGTPDVESV